VIAGHETCHHKIYGLTCANYDALLVRAGGRCELCAIPAGQVYRGKLVIDHESRIGWEAVRGLVCQRCNAHMRRVDCGERPVDRRILAYLDLAGHFVPQGADFRWPGGGAEVRQAIVSALADAERDVRPAKPRLACAPRAASALW
jgi:hypothetical protein